MPRSLCRGKSDPVQILRRNYGEAASRKSSPSRTKTSRVKVAFYGRFSSDNQRDTSIEDQRRVVLRWVETHGHEIIANFSDSAVSGASVQRLNGLQEALRSAFVAPTPFDAIVVDQLSRLSRDIGDTDALIKRLRFVGVRIIAVADGIDTADDTTKVSVTVKSLVNELYLDDLRKTTKRGLDGQFLKGYATGGRTYGYRSEPIYEPGRNDAHGRPIPIGCRLVVDEMEAGLVRQIFHLFQDGLAEKAIAKRLNSQNTGRAWRPNTIYLMLQNSKYVGRFHFNRREWRKHPETGRRVYRWRPREQWESRSEEDLRIVNDDTWNAVQRRLQTRQRLFERRRSATAHLLSGLLICDRCGGRFSIVAKDYYGCRNHAESGMCPIDLRIRREAIEELVIRGLAQHLPQYVEALRVAASRQAVRSAESRPVAVRRQLARFRRQAEAIIHGIQQGRLKGRALQEALGTYQQVWDEVERLEQKPQLPGSESLAMEIHYDRAVVEDFVARLPEALRTDIRLGREFLRETLEYVRVVDGGYRQRTCPICDRALGKITPQHIAQHGLNLQEGYRRYPELGFTKGARLNVQPSPAGLLRTGEVFGLMVAGARNHRYQTSLDSRST
jgi:site-specific DNA recombinase